MKVFILTTYSEGWEETMEIALFQAETAEDIIKFLGGSRDDRGAITIPLSNFQELVRRGIVTDQGTINALNGVKEVLGEKDLFLLSEWPAIVVPS